MTDTRPPTPDQSERDAIVRDLDTTLLVEAAAGTGKTTSLIDRMVALVATGACPVDTLAAVTFTRKATAEIRTRFQVALERAATRFDGVERERLLLGRAHADRCFIGTIHAFCARLLRERPIEAGIDPTFGELDDEADEELRRRAWREHVAELIATDAAVLPELEKLGLRLSPSLRRTNTVVDELEQLGLEPAELGPTFLKCADYPDVDEWPAPVVDLPSLAGVADEVRGYAEHIETLDLESADQKRDELMPLLCRIRRSTRVKDLDQPADLMGLLCDGRRFERRHIVQKRWPEGPEQAIRELDRWNDFHDRHAPLVETWLQHRYEPIARALLPAIDRYERLRAESNSLNFQDLLLRSRDLLRDHPGVRRYFRERFSHLLVDEFQDTDPIQAEVVFLLTADDPGERDWSRCQPVPGSLFVVGDPKQSIYRFRRADIVTYNQVRARVEASGGRVVPLTANFRAQRPVVEWVNRCFDQLLPAEATDCEPAHAPLQVGRLDVPMDSVTGVRTLTIPKDRKHPVSAATYEAERIARTIRGMIDEGASIPRTREQLARGWSPYAEPGDFLIVTRTKHRLSIYANELQRLGIPVDVTGGSVLNDVSELGLLHGYLRALVRPDDAIATVAVLRGGLFGVSDTMLYELRRAGGTFRFHSDLPEGLEESTRTQLGEAFDRMREHARIVQRESPAVAIERIVSDLGLLASAAASSDGAEAAGSLLKAVELLRGRSTLTENVVEAVGRFVSGDATHDGLDVAPSRERPVRVMNLHKCKGLEAPVVFLADPSGVTDHPIELFVDRRGEGTVGHVAVRGRPRSQYQPAPLLAHPPGWSEFEAEEKRFREAEERRLLYVAATRAGVQLVVSRRDDEKQNAKNPWRAFEPFLDGIPELESAGPVDPPEFESSDWSAGDWDRECAEVDERWSRSLSATYAVGAAKEMSVSKGWKPRSSERDGAAWGTLLHTLLEAAMRVGVADLEGLALATATGLDLDVALVDEALATVTSVVESELWKRAAASEECLVEVPFSRLVTPDHSTGDVETVVRGVVDLAFREPDGWVLVDYKSERVGEEEHPALVDHYRGQLDEYGRAWESITGATVKERGVFFTHTGSYLTT